MLRIVAGRAGSSIRQAIVPRATIAGVQARASHGNTETDEEFDARYEKFFNRPDIDHWEIRKAMNDLAGEFDFFFFFTLSAAAPIFSVFVREDDIWNLFWGVWFIIGGIWKLVSLEMFMQALYKADFVERLFSTQVLCNLKMA